MIVGDPQDFAIEAYHEPSGPKWFGCGRLCLHIGGVPVGDIRDNHCSLFVVADRFRKCSAGIEKLWIQEFQGLSEVEIFRLIDDDIYTDKPPSKLGSGLGRFDFLTNSAEMFDGTKTFIFCSPDDRVHILYRLRDNTFGSGSWSNQAFRHIAMTYVQWFDEQVHAKVPVYFPINPFDLNEKVPDDWGR